MVSDAFKRMRVNLLFTVEDDEDHTEGIQGGHECTDQTCNHQVHMTIRHRTGQNLIFTEEARSNEWQRR
ncbi:hypothetical protein D3C75_1202550 [compost metagenome]